MEDAHETGEEMESEGMGGRSSSLILPQADDLARWQVRAHDDGDNEKNPDAKVRIIEDKRRDCEEDGAEQEGFDASKRTKTAAIDHLYESQHNETKSSWMAATPWSVTTSGMRREQRGPKR